VQALEFAVSALVTLAALDDAPRLPFGDSYAGALSPDASEIVVRIDLPEAGPISVLAESFDSDVAVRLETADGTLVAEDDDSGVETDAWLVVDVPRPGTYVVRTRAKPTVAGGVTVTLLRGRIAAVSEDETTARRDYWELALDRALERADTARIALASGALARLQEPADPARLLALRQERSAAARRADEALAAARAAQEAGDASGARTRLAAAIRDLLAIEGNARDAVVVDRLGQAATAAFHAGELPAARAAWPHVLAHLGSFLPDDHPRLRGPLWFAAHTHWGLNDFAGSRAHLERSTAALERVLPEDHPDLSKALADLATTMGALGDYAGARPIHERILAAYERTLPADDPELVSARSNLALALAYTGDLPRARAMQEDLLAFRLAHHPEDHPLVQHARSCLALTLYLMADYLGARRLQEAVVAAHERAGTADGFDGLSARGALATTLWKLGDLPGARAMQEEVLAAESRLLAEDHPYVLTTLQNLAIIMWQMGDARGASATLENVLARAEKALPPTHVGLLYAKGNLAQALKDLGELEAALALEREVAGAFEASRPEDDIDRIRSQGNVAETLLRMGDGAGARGCLESVLASLERTFSGDHPDVRSARRGLVRTLAALGESAELRRRLDEMIRHGRHRAASLRLVSTREAGEIGRDMGAEISAALSFAPPPSSDAALADALFAWIESRRAALAGTPDGGIDAAAEKAIAAPRERAHAARKRLADLVAGAGGGAPGGRRPTPADVAAAARDRDRAEAELRDALRGGGIALAEVERSALAKALPKGSAAVGYVRYARSAADRGRPSPGDDVVSLAAHVVRADGALARVDLGPIDAVGEAIREWREAVGSPIERGARPIDGDAASAEAERGARVRRLVLDPVLAAAGPCELLFVCADDALHLLPLDALPDDGKGRVGDRVRIRMEVSFERLLSGSRPGARDAAPSFLGLGGIDYDSKLGSPAATAPEPTASLDRSGPGGLSFIPLRETRYEVEAIGDLFEATFGRSPVVLRGADATKPRLAEALPGASFVHVATHGYFSRESVRSWEEEDGTLHGSGVRLASLETAVVGLSPLALCGLALAGANRGPDPSGRVPGILTAEELSGLDLRRCELAVLSACETNVGLRRAGRGIASLQAALHAAGARAAITSLWRVDDESARTLMVDFYRRLWVEGATAADALWEAKRALRARGAAPRDWAAWVLTGGSD
jgi:tetratricopeptide (TPR) repeat protein